MDKKRDINKYFRVSVYFKLMNYVFITDGLFIMESHNHPESTITLALI